MLFAWHENWSGLTHLWEFSLETWYPLMNDCNIIFHKWKRLSVGGPPASCPPCQETFLCTLHTMVWRHRTSYGMTVTSLHGPSHQRLRKFTFSNMATLTFDPWPWPLNSSKIWPRYIPPPNFRFVLQTVQPWERWQTDRQTDMTDFIPSIADAGGKKTYMLNIV